MRGIFLSFDETNGRGRIEANGHQYSFESSTLPQGITVQLGQPVNFTARGDTVTGCWAATPPPAHTVTWRWFLFSFQGRISCGHFWLRYWLPTRLAAVLWLLAGMYIGQSIPRSLVTDAVVICLVLTFLWISVMVEIKRWHDRDKSGWWVLIQLIPLVGFLWTLVECGFLKGNADTNRFGAPPDTADA